MAREPEGGDGIAAWAGRLADEIAWGAAEARDRALDWTAALWEPTVRVGVTGVAGAGKTVFITGLVAGLLARGRMHLLAAEAEGRIEAAMLTAQPDPAVPRFAYEDHLAALRGDPPAWPHSTRAVSQLRLSLRVRPAGMRGSLMGARAVHVDIVDYPGEWLMDLALLEEDFAGWSARAIEAARSPARSAHAAPFERALAAADPAAAFAEPAAQTLADAFTRYLSACREAGLSALAPGRFLMPGELEGSPALTFAPLPRPDARPPRGSLYAELEARFEAYKTHVVRPFFRDHFARLDRQVVLVDALSALAAGPRALADLTAGLGETLAAFRHGQGGILERILAGRRIDRLLVAASKADHLHHAQHDRLTALVEAMLSGTLSRAAFEGTEIRVMALAALRATVEQETARRGEEIPLVRGRREGDGKEIATYPGELPADPEALIAGLKGAAGAPEGWPGEGPRRETPGYAAARFRPPRWSAEGAMGPPHIRLDRAIEFLIGDKLE